MDRSNMLGIAAAQCRPDAFLREGITPRHHNNTRQTIFGRCTANLRFPPEYRGDAAGELKILKKKLAHTSKYYTQVALFISI